MKRLALFLLLACPIAAMHSPVAEMPTGWTLPDSVYSPVGFLPIERNMAPCGKVDNFGCFDNVRMVIQIRDSMAVSVTKVTLYHEQFHVALFLQGISLGPMEDHVADVTATYRVGEENARH